MHECNRETCPTASVSGPKANCLKCKKLCYLLCHGAEKSSTGLIRFKLQNGLTIYVDVTTSQFACSKCVLAKNVVVQTTMQVTQKATKEINVGDVTNNTVLEELKAGFIVLKEHIEANVGKSSREIMNSVEDLKKVVNSTSKVSDTPSGLTNCPLYSSVVKRSKKVLFNDVAKSKFNQTPASKRKRNDESANSVNSKDSEGKKIATHHSRNFPKPMIGRSDAIIGQKPKPWMPKSPKRRSWNNGFSKSLRVAGLHPSVTVEQLSDYIINNTPLTDRSKFDCMMLVKKGQDLSELTYVSAKIDVLPEEFDGLLNLDFWPNYVTVREFIPRLKPERRISENEETQPNKLIRTNDDNLLSTPKTSNLGFREEMETQN